MQNRPNGFTAAAAGKLCLHQPDQATQRPAWLRISADYRWTGGLLLRAADLVIEGGGNLWAKGGQPPLR